MKSSYLAIAIALVAMGPGLALAQTTIAAPTGSIYATGDNPFGGWNPGGGAAGITGGTAADLELVDTGANGDAVAGDGIYSRTIDFTTAALVTGNTTEYKVAGPGFSYPDGPANLKFKMPTSRTATFYWDRNIPTFDNYQPASGRGGTVRGRVWDSAAHEAVTTATSVRFAGSFQSELGGADFTPATGILLLNDGVAPDAAVDNIWTATVTGLPAGTYAGKIVLNDAYGSATNVDFGSQGAGGGDYSFAVISTGDVNTIRFRSSATTGQQIQILSSNPTIAVGPPFYAVSSAWSTTLGAGTILTEAGGVHSATFTVPTPGFYTARVIPGLGPVFPASADNDTKGYPFRTQVANEQVVVRYDTNALADTSFYPNDDIVTVLSLAGRNTRDFSNVQPVGSWQSEFGSTDYNNNEPLMFGNDAGTGGDVTAGDGIFAVTLAELNSITGVGALKALATTTAAPEASRWDLQLGGFADGVVRGGDNSQPTFNYTAGTSYVFQMDVVTGRVGVGAAKPNRPAYLSYASVSDWTMF